MSKRKYEELYKQFKLQREIANQRLKTLPRTSQAWKSFKANRYDIYGTRTRTQKFKDMAYPKSRKQAEMMQKALDAMNLLNSYKSSTEKGRLEIREAKKETFEKHPENDDIDFEDFMGWLENVSKLSYVSLLDSNLVVEYGKTLFEEYKTIKGVENYMNDIFGKAEEQMRSDVIREKGRKYFEKMLKGEKDKKIAEIMVDYIEKQFPNLFTSKEDEGGFKL